jgi:endo-1,4-beta-xylanase
MDYIAEWTKNLDLQKLGLEKYVDDNIRQNRMSTARLRVVDSEGNPVSGAKVTLTQKTHDFNFGCNGFMAGHLDTPQDNCEYERVFTEVFNQVVLPFYWTDDEPEQGKPRFEKDSPYIYRRPCAEDMLEFCARTGARPKGHNMIWQHYTAGLPKWFPKDNPTLAQKLIDKRIRELAEHYADRIPMWDVTNEVINAEGQQLMPRDFDIRAFKLASELFPYAHLILNDYHCFFADYHRRYSALYLQALRLIEHGCRVDGIGMQYHLFTKKEDLAGQTAVKMNAEYMLRMMDTYSQLDRDIHVSEITVPSYDGTPEMLEAQERITVALYKLWFSMKKVKSIVWWNMVDGYAFIDPQRPWWNEDYYGGGLMMHDMTPKPAFKAVEHIINKEWRTNLTAETDEGGYLAFSGFHGEYDAKVAVGSETTETGLHLRGDDLNMFEIKLQGMK